MFDAYKIGVTLSLTNHVSKGLMLMAKDFAKTEEQASLLQKRIKSIQNDALKGGLFLGLGAGMLALLKGPYEEAKKLAQAQANFQTLNLSALENSEAFGKAASMSHKILGTTITDNVKLIHDLHTAFGDLHHAIGTADIFAQMSIVAKVANGGSDVDGLVNAAAKALEHRGGKVINNPLEFDAEANLMTKVMLATKMRVSPKDYLTASGTGKMAYQMYDKEYLYGNFAGRMAINGGARSGTEGMTAFSSLIGGHMDSKGKGFLADLGLWQEGFSKKRLGIMHQAMAGLTPEERKIATTSMGGQAVISGGLNDADAELFAHRPDLFVAKMIPLVRQRFGLDMTDDQIALMVAKNLNRSTGNDLGTQVTMALKLAKDTAIINKTMDIGSGYQHYMKSPEGAEQAASAAWKNFLTVFGSVYLPQITNGLLKLASGLDSLGKWVGKNQVLVKGLVYAFALLAGGLMMRGAVLLLSAAFRGLGLSLMFQAAGGVAGIAKIGPTLLGAAGALSKLGLAANIGGTFFLGWQLGTWLNETMIAGTKFGDWIGSFVAHLMAPFSSEARNAIKANSGKEWYEFGPSLNTGMMDKPGGYYDREAKKMANKSGVDSHVATASSRPIVIQNSMVLDGKVVANAVNTINARKMSAPQSGIGRIDFGITTPSPGMNF
ncbi:hypothetical protein [Glaciimonas sp. PCH181]|uniref:hypothetical protein n=1 Tax=Glaciimonas sp. PCH181 TaxID=2133943 RepID=UPI000D38D214|nr:hypothetical protein [Glaciimonas sp. PCH181]PUA19577.1 hypothetical protein C7W93_06950 [Glaciimonas sp. PCH181]